MTYRSVMLGCVMAAFAAVSLAQVAQADDKSYCKALADKYRAARSSNQAEANVVEAIAACDKGNTATGIPVLEAKLKDMKVTLPPRN